MPQLSVAGIQSGQVTLNWQPPPDQTSPPELYIVAGGVLPGQTLASVPADGTATSVSVTLGPGTYYARLYEVREGVLHGPSNEVLIGMSTDLPPSAPTLRALTLGPDVALAWWPSFEGGVPTDMVLEVSGPITATFSFPPSGSISFGDVPTGTYVLSLRARNASGTSDPSPVTLELPGTGVRAAVSPVWAPDAARLPVRYENYAAPRLAAYAARENLAAVASGSGTEFDAILRLKDWVAAQWEVGIPDPYPPWDAMTVLDWIRGGVTGGFCGQYSQVFLQALAAFGVPARYIEIGHTQNPYNHFTTEVWSNDFNKWVMLDAYFNSYFARGGIPLSALEVRDALLHDQLANVDVVVGAVRAGHPSPHDFPMRTAELYYYVRYHLNANHVSAPDEDPFNRFEDMVEFLDGQTVPWESSEVPSEFPHERLTLLDTGDRTLVDWSPNQLWISTRRVGTMQVAIDLQHSMFLPLRVEYRVVDHAGVAGPWQAHPGTGLTWTVAATDRLFEVRAVNLMGRRGPVSSIEVVPAS